MQFVPTFRGGGTGLWYRKCQCKNCALCTDMCCLKMWICSEKCVTRWFHCCANIEHTYTNLKGIAYYTSGFVVCHRCICGPSLIKRSLCGLRLYNEENLLDCRIHNWKCYFLSCCEWLTSKNTGNLKIKYLKSSY